MIRIIDRETFEKQDSFGLGAPNEMFAQYFTGDSFLKPLTVANVIKFRISEK